MNIGILGSGVVGQVVGGKLAELGHDVTIGTRDPSALDTKRGQGDTLRAWLDKAGERGRVATFDEAARQADLVINATSGAGSLHALELAGAEHLAGKTLIDISNPLDFSQGFPPTLFVKDDDSLAEQIQRAHPRARVVKALSSMAAALMVDPRALAGGDHTVFLSGDDAAAKVETSEVLRAFGWTDILDLGPLSTARGTEMLLPIWLRTWQALGTTHFQFKVVR